MARLTAEEIADLLGRPRPTPEQRAVIEAPHDHALVVAGAGSGKTETMASRVVWLVANGVVAPSQVLGLTFTRKAATELGARIGQRLRVLRDARALEPADEGRPDLAEAATVSTYHAYAGRLVTEHGLLLGIEPDARLLTPASAWQLAHEVTTSYDGPMDAVDAAESTVTRAVVQLSGALAEHLRAPADLEAWGEAFTRHVAALPAGSGRSRGLPADVRALMGTVAARRQIVPILTAYAQAKLERSALDFADQVALAARLAGQFPAVARGERARYAAVLLDEFQDTSDAQLTLLHELFGAPGAGTAVPVMAVGDPHQSIYGWRGASAATLSQFGRLFPAAATRRAGRSVEADPCGTVLPLSVSWRNDEDILAAANVVSAPLRDGPVPVRRLVPAPGAQVGLVEAVRLETVADEAAHVAARIAAAWFRPDGRPTGVTAAVLCRRRAQFPPVVEALRQRGLPVEIVGLGGLLTTPEVQDLVAALTVAHDPRRSDRLLRLLVGPACRLGAADLDGLSAWARRLRHLDASPSRRAEEARRDAESGPGPDPVGSSSGRGGDADGGRAGACRTETPGSAGGVDAQDEPGLVEALDRLPPSGWVGPEGQRVSDEALARLSRLRRAIRHMRAVSAIGLADLVGEAERSLGIDLEVAARPDRPLAEARVHLDAFAEAAASFQASAERPSLGAFLDWLDAAAAEEQGLDVPVAAVSERAVQVLTVHAAKGLEWDVVAVPGLVEGTFPATSATSSTLQDGRWVVPAARDKGWCVGLDRLPYDLRRDAGGLPRLDWRAALDGKDLGRRASDFFEDGGRRAVEEERRLAYVALTRARHVCLLTCPVWTDATTPRVTSRFLVELLEASRELDPSDGGAEHPSCAAARVRVGPWVAMPEPQADGRAERPAGARPLDVAWPHSRDHHRRALLDEAAELLRDCAAQGDARAWDAEIARGAAAGSALDREILALLDERDAMARRRAPSVRLPAHLSASALVSLAADEESYAAELRRPMPRPPALGAREGREFHAWVEGHYQRATMLDLDDLPGSADETAVDVKRSSAVRTRFLGAQWADRVPVDVELPVETTIAGVSVRGRIDAVFPDPDPDADPRAVVIVDWKTGRQDPRRAAAVATQLAVYRLAYARLRGLDLALVRAGYYDAATGRTAFPDLPSVAQLREVLVGAGARVAEDSQAAAEPQDAGRQLVRDASTAEGYSSSKRTARGRAEGPGS